MTRLREDATPGQAANAPLPDGYVIHMPALKHTFHDPVSIPAAKSITGRPQTERTCKVCGAVKVTLHGDDHGRAWRTSADAPQIETFDAPVCVPIGNGTKA